MRFPFLRPAPALAALTLFTVAPAAQAGIIVTLGSMTPTAGGFRFSYNTLFDGLDASPFVTITLEPGDLFTIYDFAGFVPGTSQQPVDWSFTSALTGTNPGGFPLAENAAVPNLTWTYTGPSRIVDGSLGVFSAVSLFSTMASTGLAGAENTLTITGVGPTPSVNVLGVFIPAAPQPAAAVPEPGTLALAGISLLPLLGMIRHRRRA